MMIATAALPAASRSVAALLAGEGGVPADELRRLERKLAKARGLAADAEAKEGRDARARAWLRELRDALYELGDAVDDYRSAAARRQLEGRRSLRHWFPLPSSIDRNQYKTLKTSISNLNTKMKDILKKGSDLELEAINQEGQNGRSDFSWEVICDDDTLGDIENEKNELIDVLTDRKSANKVVTIVGGSGIGKTTLAQKIHEDHRTRNAFSIVVWVSVFSDFNDTGLLSAIVRAAGGNTKGEENRVQLEVMLAAILKGKRFLLVLDDVRSHQISDNSLGAHWHLYGHGNRILITTRDETVVTKVKDAHIHQVKKLSFQDCWSLLCRNACLDESIHDNTLRNIGISIIQKCNKLPMAVKIIGAVLRTKEQTQEAWQSVQESKGWFFKDLRDYVHGLTEAIFLGYHDLPLHLKQCFIYLSLFPEGFVIRQQFVSQLWISEGLIEERDNCSLEKTAEEYYRELLSRKLLQPEIGNDDTTRCTMHDHIRSFLQFFAKDKIFSGELKSIDENSGEALRHVWIRSNIPTTTVEEIETVASLKTVILYKIMLGNRSLDELFHGLKYLHVLDLGGAEIKYIPRKLESLYHLRLLNLSLTRITELPESIEYLTNLQFLGLRYCNWLHNLPNGIGKLKYLRNLDLRGTNLHQVLPSLVNLKQLATLNGFVVNRKSKHEDDPTGWPLEDLKSLDALRSLQILRLERISDSSRVQETRLETKSHLKELELCCSNDDRQSEVLEEDARTLKDVFDRLSPPHCLKSLKIVSYYGKLFPDWLPNLSNLQRLVLTDCKFCEHLPNLGQLTALKFLTITSCSKLVTIKQERTSTGQAFPKLEQLHLRDMANLQSWIGFAPDDMPSLVKFRLENCPKLHYLPSGIKNSKVLTSMQLRHVDSLQIIDDLPVLKELVLQACNELGRISNLPLLEVLIVLGCSQLKNITKVHLLSHVRIVDRELRELPDWLAANAFMLQTFTIVGTAELLQRLLPNHEDWEIIRHISKVYANLPDESPFFTYTKSSADFHVDQRIGEQGNPPVLSGAGIPHEALSISLDNSVVRTSRIGALRVQVRRMLTLKRAIRRYLVLYLIMTLIVMQVLSYLLQNRTNRDIWLVQTLVIFFTTVLLLLLVFIE
ncbi:putative disease resistance RPP13-like protein 1 [Dichanthelium oligosanthes]|uniref:Putative disease resistance RPP13-like protein 1 n=1 Tax=Dichanthelium oligosanthes TaxID=888268 RepID=A0A1E5VIE2_9POAL|nr:putative disease resistance RPP13-like protein 1 [Dichanthelium oligosanthes]